MAGISICLYGDSGSGKTTQIGEYAKSIRKTRAGNTYLYTSDLGGYGGLGALVRRGVVIARELEPGSDPWIWTDDAVKEKVPAGSVKVFDSGTSLAEALLDAAAYSDFQIGQQRTQKFVVAKGDRNLTVAANNEAHYGVVQGFMLKKIWESMSALKNDVDVIWTFSVLRGEEQDRSLILGPKLAGKALTPAMPKWFNYTFRIVSLPQEGQAPAHRLYLTEHSELAGMGHSFGNARYPMGATTELPPFIEPASLPGALELIEQGQREADAALDAELG